jgi:hypothetical protein
VIRVLLVVFISCGIVACASAPRSDDSSANRGPEHEAIRATIRKHLADIRKCYEIGLEKDAHLNGKLVLQWDIGDKGRVYDVRVARPLLAEVDDCIAGLVEGWTFPPEAAPKAGDNVRRVIFPFVFSAQDAQN